MITAVSLVLAAALAAGSPTFTPAHPYPVDHRPCVSKREFNGYDVAETKAETEARWEVEGLGRQADVIGYGRAVLYPRCGYRIEDGWYGVHYEPRDGRLWGVGLVWWHENGVHPIGRP